MASISEEIREIAAWLKLMNKIDSLAFTGGFPAQADRLLAVADHLEGRATSDRPSQEEILEYLLTVRPEMREGEWRRCDPLTVMEWAIPGFIQWKAQQTQDRSPTPSE